MPRSPRPWTVLTIVLALALATPLMASAAGHRRDITHTPRGHQLARESAARFTDQGVPTDPSDLAVIELPDGGVTVLPAHLASSLVVSSQTVDGAQRFSATVDVGGTLTSAAAATSQAAAAPYPLVRESNCFSSMFVRTARFDVCYQISQVINDADGTKDYWAIEQWGTAFESASGLRSAYVSGQRRTGTNTQTWVRWAPVNSITQNCASLFIGVSYPVTVGGTYEVCEKWTLTKSAGGTSPYLKTEWGCNFPFCSLSRDDRAVSYTMMTSLGQGKAPQYTLSYGMDHA